MIYKELENGEVLEVKDLKDAERQSGKYPWLPDYYTANCAYLASLLDSHHISEKSFSIGGSKQYVHRLFRRINKVFHVNGKVSVHDATKDKTTQKRAAAKTTTLENIHLTYKYRVGRAEDVLKLCEAALPYVEQEKEVMQIIEQLKIKVAKRAALAAKIKAKVDSSEGNVVDET
jgi:hypothetical protein